MPIFNTYPLVSAMASGDTLLIWQSSSGKVKQVSKANLRIVAQVKTIALLKALVIANLSDGDQVEVAGFSSEGDGGGGVFVYDVDSVLADNGGTIIEPDSGVGAYLRRGASEFVYPEFWGGFANGSTNCSPALVSALSIGAQVRFSSGTYNFSTTVAIPENSCLIGAGQATTTLRFTGTGPLFTFATTVGDGNLTLQDFNVTTTNAGATYFLKSTNGYHVSLFRVKVQAAGKFTGGCIWLNTVSPGNIGAWSILSCQLLQTGGDGITITGNGGVGGLFVSHTRIQGNVGYGIKSTATLPCELQIVSNTIEGNQLGAIYCELVASTQIIGNHFEQGSNSAIPLVLGNNGGIEGLEIRGNNMSGNGTNEVLIDLLPNASANQGVLIEGNSFQLAALGAIRYRQIWGFSVRNNSRVVATCPQIVVQPGTQWELSRSVFIEDQSATRFMGWVPGGGAPSLACPSFDSGLVIGGSSGNPGVRGPAITAHMSATKTYDAPSIANGAQTTTTVTVTGAALGDLAQASMSIDIVGLQLTAYVSAADTVTVVFKNDTGGAVDLGSGTLRASVWSYVGRLPESFPW